MLPSSKVVRLTNTLLASLILSCPVGYSKDLVLDDLLLDLNADVGVTIEDENMVTTWTNQAPNPKARDFHPTEEGRTETIISQDEPPRDEEEFKRDQWTQQRHF